MAASDAFYRDQRMLHRVFAATSVAMLVTVVWMFADDFRRPYKQDQRTFRTVEEEISKRTLLALAPSAAEQQKIVASETQVTELRDRVNKLKPIVEKKISPVAAERAALDFKMRSIKADYDSRMSYYNIAVEHQDPHANRFKEEAEKFQKNLQALQPKLEELDAKIEAANNEEIQVGDAKVSLAQAQRDLKAKEATHKKHTGDFDRFLKLAVQKQWTWRDAVRSLPVMDAFASPVKIKQTFHEDLPIDYGGFKYVTRYDRCTTCHLGIDRPNLDAEALTRLTTNPMDDPELKKKTEDAKKLLEERQQVNKDAKQDVNVLAARDLEPKKVEDLSPSRIREYAAHPRLDLFVEANSPHSAQKFGCTICHSGQGSATGFNDAAHTPNDVEIAHTWEQDLHWQSVHAGDWEFPMLPSRFIESSCVKCHHQVEDLVRDGSRVEAEKLIKGYHLVKDLGCFGCHEISGTKSGRAIGPDMRLEPDPPLESLSPSERTKRLADAANPPGTLRKVGPSLFRVAEKTNEDWAMKWIKAPRAFKPDTKMPHFYMQANNVDEALPSEQKKFPDAEIRAITHYIFTKSKQHLGTLSAVAKAPAEQAQADEALINELTAKLAQSETMSDADKKDASRKIREAKARMSVRGQVPPVDESMNLPAEPANDAGKKEQFDRGRHLFATRGCVACHQHSAAEAAGQNANGTPAPAIVGESYFGPELSGVAGKLNSKKWLVQWLLNPMVHSPRTLMPNVHLTLEEANDVASWLLSQPAKTDPEWDTLAVAPAERETLADMARMYLRKAGLTTREVENAVKSGFSKDELSYRADDADEQELSAPLDDGKLMTYIGKKAIGNLGCFACHNIPGFEGAKTIGVGLNDWGKKDPDRIAFEDVENYVDTRYHVVDLRDDPKDKNKPDKDWKPGDGKQKPLEKFAPYTTAKQPPYEKFFSEMLDHHHRSREGFLHLKLMSPRVYDYQRVRDWNDRARMPQFKFARIRRLPNESDEAFQIRLDKDEAEGREAVMCFILGLIAEPIPQKFLPSYTPERQAEVHGRMVLEKYNCYSCHIIRAGQFEFALTDKKLPDGRTAKAAVMKELTEAYQRFASGEKEEPKDPHAYLEHNAWGAAPPPAGTDRIVAKGVMSVLPNGDDLMPVIRTTHALAFRYDDPDSKSEKTAVLPAWASPIIVVPEATKELAAPYGGRFALLLKRYLSEYDSKVYGDVQPVNRYDDEGGKGPDGYAAIPPNLLHEGERVQPGWLYQFLLNPYKIRKIPPLMMPKFSLSDDEAVALVNYFTAANKLGNPGTGLNTFAKVPQRDEAYLLQQTKDYVAKLKANNQYDARINELKPLWARVAREQQAAAERRVTDFRAAGDNAKVAEAQKDADRLRAQVAGNDFPELRKNWEEREAYMADAWKLVTYTGNLCITCHQVGPALPNEYRAPDLDKAWERLRPEWTERWIAYPQRLTPYASLMQPQYRPGEAKKHFEEAKVFIGGPEDQIRASRDLLMMYPTIVDWPVIKYRVGPTAFGQPAAAAPPAK
ncbi:MAG: c-type cytochrome [Gemmataceae bacterium]